MTHNMTDRPVDLTEAINALGRARRGIAEAEMKLFRIIESMQEMRSREPSPITSAPGFDGRARGSGDDFPCDTEGGAT